MHHIRISTRFVPLNLLTSYNRSEAYYWYSLYINVSECVESTLRVDNASEFYDGMGGPLEICFNGVWSAICSSTWTLDHASVACRQMGITESMSVKISSNVRAKEFSSYNYYYYA